MLFRGHRRSHFPASTLRLALSSWPLLRKPLRAEQSHYPTTTSTPLSSCSCMNRLPACQEGVNSHQNKGVPAQRLGCLRCSKTVNISQGTLDRNTLLCAEFLTDWQESLPRNKGRFIGKKREGSWDCMRSGSEKKKMVLVRRYASQPAKKTQTLSIHLAQQTTPQ